MKYAATSKQLMHRSALYTVWTDMMRTARQEQAWNAKFKLPKPYPVEEEFREFELFALWARHEQGYEIGRDDQKQLVRKDIHAPFGPGNCYFADRSEIVLSDDTKVAVITKGASGAFQARDYRWNGQSKTRLYNIWKTMCRECSDQNHKDYAKYGGKGIRVCEQWRADYLVFEDWSWEHGYNDQLSLTRLDRDKGFSPRNCRWETDPERRCYNLVKYAKVRLTVKRMREYLDSLDDKAIVTLIVSQNHVMPVNGEQDDFPPTPVEDRIDSVRS